MMNVYNCCFHGKNWMFVPEMGQTNNRVIRNITILDLQFYNLHEKEYELTYENQLVLHMTVKILKALMLPVYRSQTVSGHLFHRF